MHLVQMEMTGLTPSSPLVAEDADKTVCLYA